MSFANEYASTRNQRGMVNPVSTSGSAVPNALMGQPGDLTRSLVTGALVSGYDVVANRSQVDQRFVTKGLTSAGSEYAGEILGEYLAKGKKMGDPSTPPNPMMTPVISGLVYAGVTEYVIKNDATPMFMRFLVQGVSSYVAGMVIKPTVPTVF